MKFVLVALLACLVLTQVHAGCWWRRNCVWSAWSSWCVCVNGVSTRTRYHRVTQRCSGQHCTGPSRQTKTCGCGHGHESGGRCICDIGWHGPSCSLIDCGLHGHESRSRVRCICDIGWYGPNCGYEVIHPDCGLHGHESGEHCICDIYWYGSSCRIYGGIDDCGHRGKRSLRICCGHGHHSGGRCICDSGWRGSSCSIGERLYRP